MRNQMRMPSRSRSPQFRWRRLLRHWRPRIQYKSRAASRFAGRRLFRFPSRGQQRRARGVSTNLPHHAGIGWLPESTWTAGTSQFRVVPYLVLAVKGLVAHHRFGTPVERFSPHVCPPRQRGGIK